MAGRAAAAGSCAPGRSPAGRASCCPGPGRSAGQPSLAPGRAADPAAAHGGHGAGCRPSACAPPACLWLPAQGWASPCSFRAGAGCQLPGCSARSIGCWCKCRFRKGSECCACLHACLQGPGHPSSQAPSGQCGKGSRACKQPGAWRRIGEHEEQLQQERSSGYAV